jgi:uracil-DNA glycosylase
LIDSFVAQLATAAPLPHVTNHYAYTDEEGITREANKARRENLRLYLRQMVVERPSFLLVGEAPGYRGCRVTGVPFTNKRLLLDQGRNLIKQGGFRVAAEDNDLSRHEATAAIMWQTLQNLGFFPLLWNAFPFHPYQPGAPLSNRRPTRHELEVGATYLLALIDIFRPQRLVAVGNCAADSLSRSGLPHDKVRHPSHGGKRAFTTQLHALLTDYGLIT